MRLKRSPKKKKQRTVNGRKVLIRGFKDLLEGPVGVCTWFIRAYDGTYMRMNINYAKVDMSTDPYVPPTVTIEAYLTEYDIRCRK